MDVTAKKMKIGDKTHVSLFGRELKRELLENSVYSLFGTLVLRIAFTEYQT